MQKLIKYTIDEMIKKYYKNEIDILTLIENFTESTLVLTREEFKKLEQSLSKLLIDYNKTQDEKCFSYNFNAIEDNGRGEDEELIEIDLLIDYKKENTYHIEVELLDEYVSTSDDFVKLYTELKNGIITLSEFCDEAHAEEYLITKQTRDDFISDLDDIIKENNEKNKTKFIYSKNWCSKKIFLCKYVDTLICDDYTIYLNIV